MHPLAYITDEMVGTLPCQGAPEHSKKCPGQASQQGVKAWAPVDT